MAKMLCINELTKRDCNNLGDIVVVFEDSQQPTSAELINFEIVYVSGTQAEVWELVMSKVPQIVMCWKDEQGGYHEFEMEPSYPCRWEDGEIKHNYI